MEERFEKLEREVQELKARALADATLLHCLVARLPVEQLEAVERDFAKLAEDTVVAFIYGPWPEVARQAFEAKRSSWTAQFDRTLGRAPKT